MLDTGTVARLEDRITKDRELASSCSDHAGQARPQADQKPHPQPDLEPDATVDYEGISGDATSPGDSAGTPRFQVLEPHARGGLGEVFLAFDRELNRSVALKQLQSRRAHDATSQRGFFSKVKSPADSSTLELCRSTAWADTPTAAPIMRCG